MDDLKDIFDNVNNWLKFAEAKNAALIAISGMFIWGSVRLLVILKSTEKISMDGNLGCVLTAYLFFMLVFFTIALICGIASFIPVSKYILIIPTGEPSNADNLLFFGHLSKYNKKKLVEKVKAASDSKDTDINDIHQMYAEQIIVNSRITEAKIHFFNIGSKSILLGILTFPVGALFLWKLSKNEKGFINGFR